MRESGEGRKGARAARIALRDFRNYASLDLELNPGLTVVCGPNAQGKTNLLEAAYLVATTRLLRGSREGEAVREGTERARVAIELAESRTELAVVLEGGKRKTGQLNGASLPRAADLIGRLPTVCVSLSDMAIVRGEPNERRSFLDLELAQLFPAYLSHLAYYKRALEQRGALLRRAREFPVAPAEFEPWEETLAEHGAAIRRFRREYVGRVEGPAAEIHAQFGGGEGLETRYEARDEARTTPELRQGLESGRERDIARGSTQYGPHRDDLALVVEGRDIRNFGSQGQQRTAVLALKLAAFGEQTATHGKRPLLLLDDMLSELDLHRRKRLTEWILAEAGQALLTCTEAEAAGEELLGSAQVLEVRSGEVRAR